MLRRSRPLIVVLVALAGSWCVAGCELPASIALSHLGGTTTPTTFTLDVDVAGATSAKLVLDGVYAGSTDVAPMTFAISVAPGGHTAKVRATVGDAEQEVTATFTATSATTSTTPSVPPTTEPTTTEPTTTDPTTTVPTVPGEVLVDTLDELTTAVASATPGTIIRIAPGEYLLDRRLAAAASGTPAKPITLRGTRSAIVRTKNTSGDYGLHITGDHWRIEGITVAHATKGIVLDGSTGTVIDGVEVFDIGDEAIHFRRCSSDGVLRNSYVHDTGRNSPQYGEGVYVGSASSNWASYQCTDPIEGRPIGDNTERVLIENNVFEDVTAEGADLKEGTDSGVLRRNQFRRTGTSGQNSADSAVDAKGNNWVIEDNVVSETDAPWDDHGVARPSEFLDGYQTHSVTTGYGTGNVLRRNSVVGAVPGFGVGLNPGMANVVTCDNRAPGAAKGLVGDKNKPTTCT